MDLTTGQRALILRYASSLLSGEDRRNPVLTGKAALPLIEWAEHAIDGTDLHARMEALERHHQNTFAGRDESGSPDKFVEDAGVYYALLAAGQEDGA